MFTGLVETKGTITSIDDQPPGKRLTIDAGCVAEGAAIGDSISINGCCLTVVAIDDTATKRYKVYYYYEADAWELYCLSDDPGEANNLIEEQPDIASELSVKIRAWLSQKHPTWKPKYPIAKATGQPAGPPPLFSD